MSLLRETSSGVYNRTSSAVAWSGSILGVTKVDNSNLKALSFATYGGDLTQFSSDRKIADASFAGVNALLWNGSEFGLFYQDRSAQLFLQRISASGEPIGSAVAIAPNHAPSGDREYDVVWDATRQAYVILHSVVTGIDKGMWLTMLNTDGTVRSDELITVLFTAPASPRLAVNASGVIAVVFRRSGIFNLRVYDAAGVGGALQQVMNAKEVRIASNGTTFAIVGNAPLSAPTEIDWAVVDDHGTIVAPPKKLFAAHGVEIAPVSLSWNADRGEWALAYLDSRFPFSVVPGDYRLRRFTSSGTLISDSLFSPDTVLTTLATNQPFAWTGASYTSAASRTASGTVQPESYVIRHCPLTASAGTSVRSVAPGGTLTFTAFVDGGTSDQTYAWDFGDGHTDTAKTTTHRYDRLGDYTVVLRVSDSTGASSSSTVLVHVVNPRRHAVHH
ncbi:MAG TPA: PKD domain-containing protein [Thermoanaerobaculia bacterium]|nr:PKD domain-containing protein [Thermoanaerobaculia bacterium]